MVYGGFERDRETLKYRCPARYAGITCNGIEQCPVSDAVRIRLAEDRGCSRRWHVPATGGRATTTSAARWSESTAGWPAGSGSSERHPLPGQDAVARHHGDDDHAGNGLRAHPGRPTATPAESGQTRLTGDRSPVTTRTQSTDRAAGQVCPELSAKPRMRLDLSSRVSF